MGALDGKAAVFSNGIGTEPAVTGTNEVRGLAVKVRRRPGTEKEIPIGPEVLFLRLCQRLDARVPPGIPPLL